MSPLKTRDGDAITFTREGWIGLAMILAILVGGLVKITSRQAALEAKVDILMNERAKP